MEHEAFLAAFERTGLIGAGKAPNPAPLTGSVSPGFASLDSARRPACNKPFCDGNVSIDAAAEAGQTFAATDGATAAHSEPGATAGYTDATKAFRMRHDFIPIRLDPYLRAATIKHPECAGKLEGPANRTAKNQKAQVHDDPSSQDNLIGQSGPVFLATGYDWFSDPASRLDLRLRKRVWRPDITGNYLACDGANDAGVTPGGERRHHP